MRRRCCSCRKLTSAWEKYNGGPAFCYDGCYSTTGRDNRTEDGCPKWFNAKQKKKWLTERVEQSAAMA